MATANIQTKAAGCCSKIYDLGAQAGNYLVEGTKKLAALAVVFFTAASKYAVQGFNYSKDALGQIFIRAKDFGVGHKSEIACLAVGVAIGYLFASCPTKANKIDPNKINRNKQPKPDEIDEKGPKPKQVKI